MKAHYLARLLMTLPKNVDVYVHSSYDDCYVPMLTYGRKNRTAVLKASGEGHWSLDYSDGEPYMIVKFRRKRRGKNVCGKRICSKVI